MVHTDNKMNKCRISSSRKLNNLYFGEKMKRKGFLQKMYKINIYCLSFESVIICTDGTYTWNNTTY